MFDKTLDSKIYDCIFVYERKFKETLLYKIKTQGRRLYSKNPIDKDF